MTTVFDLELPVYDPEGLDRAAADRGALRRPHPALARADPARVHGDPLRRRRGAPARASVPLGAVPAAPDAGHRGWRFRAATAVDPVDGGRRAHARPPARRTRLHPGRRQPAPPVHAGRDRRAARRDRGARRVRLRRRRLRPVSDPDHLRAARRARARTGSGSPTGPPRSSGSSTRTSPRTSPRSSRPAASSRSTSPTSSPSAAPIRATTCSRR